MVMLKLPNEELQKRIIAAGVMIPVALVIVLVGGMLFTTLVLLLSIIMAFEWGNILSQGNKKFTDSQLLKWRIFAILYIAVPAISLIYIVGLDSGISIIIFMLLLIWATDIAAYFAGRLIGGPKLIPSISPKKTWAGLLGGMLAAAIIGALAAIPLALSFMSLAMFGAFVAVVAQAGDFCESWIKRQFGVKDSGTLIPGHGGLMDRVDGLLFVAPLFALLTIINNGKLF